MAGTRLWVATVFGVELWLLLGAAIYWGLMARNDLLVQWVHLFHQQQQQYTGQSPQLHVQDLRRSLQSYQLGSSSFLSVNIQAKTEQTTQKWNQWARKNQVSLVASVLSPLEYQLYCEHSVQESEATIKAELVLCEEEQENSKIATWTRNGTLIVTNRNLYPFMLSDSVPRQWPLQTCLDLSVDWRFLLVPSSADDGQCNSRDKWREWLQALNQVRQDTFFSWFPLSFLPHTDATVQAEYVSMTSPDKLQRKELLKLETIENQTALHLSFNEIQRFVDQQEQRAQRDNTDNMPIFVLIPPCHTDIQLGEEIDPKSLVNTSEMARIAVADDTSLFVILPAQTEHEDEGHYSNEDVSKQLLSRISLWITRQCLGLPHAEQQESQRDNKDLLFNDHVMSELLKGTLFLDKLFWNRALLELYNEALAEAQDAIQRYETRVQQDLNHPDFLTSLMPSPQEPSSHADAAVQLLATTHAQIQNGHYESAIQMLWEAKSRGERKVFSQKKTKSRAELYTLMLDLSLDQYAAIIAPLLVPLLLPSMVAFVREIKRYRTLIRQSRS